MNKYEKLRTKHSKEVNDFPMFFAFNEEQLEEGLKKLNTTKDNLVQIGGGGLIRKGDKTKYLDMIKRQHAEDIKAVKDDEYVYQMFRYELANHEYCITYDYTDTLESSGLEFDKLDNRMKKLLLKAKEDYLHEVE